jgi:hypothetical protein
MKEERESRCLMHKEKYERREGELMAEEQREIGRERGRVDV